MIRYSSRLNYDVACTMNFRRFPFDIQVNIKLDHQKFCFPSNWPCLKFVSFSSHTFFCLTLCLYMSLSNYPDEQVCTIKFESFSYSTAQLQLQWRERSASQVLFDSRGFGMIVQGWPMSFETRLHLPCHKILSSVLHSPGEPGHHPGPVCSECWPGGQLQDGLLRPGVPRSHHDYKVTPGR